MKFTVTLSDASYAELHHLLNYMAAIPVVPQAGTTTCIPAAVGPAPVDQTPPPGATNLQTVPPAVAPTLTVEQVRAKLNPHLDGPHGKAIKALCAEYSKKGLPGIPADKLAEFQTKALALVATTEAA